MSRKRKWCEGSTANDMEASGTRTRESGVAVCGRSVARTSTPSARHSPTTAAASASAPSAHTSVTRPCAPRSRAAPTAALSALPPAAVRDSVALSFSSAAGIRGTRITTSSTAAPTQTTFVVVVVVVVASMDKSDNRV